MTNRIVNCDPTLSAIAQKLDSANEAGILDYLQNAVESYLFFNEADQLKASNAKQRAKKISRLKKLAYKEFSASNKLVKTRRRLAKFKEAERLDLLFVIYKSKAPKDAFSAVFDVKGIKSGERIPSVTFSEDCTDAELMKIIDRPTVKRKEGRRNDRLAAFAIGRSVVELLVFYGYKATVTRSDSSLKTPHTLAQKLVMHTLKAARIAHGKTGHEVNRKLASKIIEQSKKETVFKLAQGGDFAIVIGSRYFILNSASYANATKTKL
jgi:hypothetical protein